MGLLSFLSGCAGQNLAHYKNMEPPLDLKEFFDGRIKGWGIVQDFSGKVTRRFEVEIIASWEGDVGTLDETFAYYDGQTQKRIWTVTKVGDDLYEGTAGDILDHATGEVSGTAMRWAYKMDLPVGDKTYRLTFDDWMYQMHDGVLINRSYLKKFGLTVAELTLFMQKQDAR